MTRTLSCAAFAVCLLTTGMVGAQPTAHSEDEAKRLLKEGKTLFLQGNYEEAYARYSQACSLARTPNCVRALAMTEVQTGRALDGYRHFRQWQADPKAVSSLDPKALDVMKQLMQQAYDKIGHITVRGAEGATVSLDGQPIGADVPSDPLDVNPGPHVVEAQVRGAVARANVVAKPGELVVAELRVEPAPAPPPPASPALTASTPTREPVPDAVSPQGSPFWNTRRWVGVGVAGVGVVSFVLSEVFNLQSNSAANRAAALVASNPSSACATNGSSATCTQLNDNISSRNEDATLSRVFLGVGIAGVAAGAVMVLWPDSASTSKTAIEPITLPRGGGGLQLRGEF